MIASGRVRLTLSWLALAVLPVQAWQPAGDVSITMSSGEMAGSARLTAGRWVADGACRTGPGAETAPAPPAGPPRVTVTGAALRPVRMVQPGASEWRRLQPTMLDLFDRRERAERVSATVSEAPRAVDWIYAADEGGRHWYYFEVSRRVASAPAAAGSDDDVDPPGTLRVAVAGFLEDAGGRLLPAGMKSELRWEQDGLPAGPAVADLTPLGIVAHGGRAIWVMQGRSGARIWFTLYDVAAAGTRTLLARRDVC